MIKNRSHGVCQKQGAKCSQGPRVLVAGKKGPYHVVFV